jgi:hypothetical protein
MNPISEEPRMTLVEEDSEISFWRFTGGPYLTGPPVEQ